MGLSNFRCMDQQRTLFGESLVRIDFSGSPGNAAATVLLLAIYIICTEPTSPSTYALAVKLYCVRGRGVMRPGEARIVLT